MQEIVTLWSTSQDEMTKQRCQLARVKHPVFSPLSDATSSIWSAWLARSVITTWSAAYISVLDIERAELHPYHPGHHDGDDHR